MTLPSSGAISLNQMHVEAGGSSGSQVSMGDTDIRDMVLAASFAQNSFSTYYGAKRAFVLSNTVGFGNITNPANAYTGDPATTTRLRGYNDGAFSNRTPGTYGFIGNVNSQSNTNCKNTDYFNNNRVCFTEGSVLSTTPSSTHASSTIHLGIDSINTTTANSAASFQRISINGTVFARSAASYSSMGTGPANQDVQWLWSFAHTFPAQSFTDNTVAIPPFTATGTSTKIVVAAV
tara:strand:- start:395 stop:1096 length:702 start_codon:yes stop_codon:yes gene_type:complete